MALVEPIIVVLGPFCGGTSAVAGVLHHLGVFMGSGFFRLARREPSDTWEDLSLAELCRKAFSEPGGQFQMDAVSFEAELRHWASEHRRVARIARRRPGAKHPSLCLAVDFIRDAWGPVVPVVVDRPAADVVASLNRQKFWPSEEDRVTSTARLIEARDLALDGTATVRVEFEALRAMPAVAIRRLAHELCLEVTQAQVEAAAESIVRRIGDLHRMLAPGPAQHILVHREPCNRPPAGAPAPPVASPSRPAVSIILLSDPEIPDAITIPDGVEAVIVPSREGHPAGPAATGSARVIPPPSAPGAPARFQAGVDATSGDVVVFCRDVVALSADWAGRVRESLDDQEVGLVSALIHPHTDPRLRLAGLEFVDQMLNVHWIARTIEESCAGHAAIEVPLLSSTFLAVRRATLAYLGGLDTGMRGDAWHDIELCLRAWRCGLRSVVLPDVVAVWQPPPTERLSSHLLHDLLRLAAVHVNQDRFAGLVASLRGSSELHPALADLFTSDVGSRRARIQHIALRDAEPLLPSAAMQQRPSDGVAS